MMTMRPYKEGSVPKLARLYEPTAEPTRAPTTANPTVAPTQNPTPKATKPFGQISILYNSDNKELKVVMTDTLPVIAFQVG
jgi:hypothetical protein